MIDKLLNVDRRYIFALIFVSVAVAVTVDVDIQLPVSAPVQRVYDFIEQIPTGDGLEPTILMSFDYGPGTDAEVQPMALALIRHARRRGIKIVGMCMWPSAPGLAELVFDKMRDELGLVYGTDYAFLGYKPSPVSLIINMGQDFRSAFATDAYGAGTDTLPVTKNIQKLSDFAYVICLAAGNSIDQLWVAYAQDRFDIDLGGGTTAVVAPDMYPYLQTGQLNGLIGGLAGAAQYEALISTPGSAISGMLAQSWAHIIIVLFIIMGNTVYFISRRRKRVA